LLHIGLARLQRRNFLLFGIIIRDVLLGQRQFGQVAGIGSFFTDVVAEA